MYLHAVQSGPARLLDKATHLIGVGSGVGFMNTGPPRPAMPCFYTSGIPAHAIEPFPYDSIPT